MKTIGAQTSRTSVRADYFSRRVLGGDDKLPFMRRSYSLPVGLTYACIAMHVAFPKGGIKYLDIPITWADASLGCLFLVFIYTFTRPLRISRQLKTTLLLMFAGIAFFAFRIFAQEGFVLRWVIKAHVQEIVPLCVYPLILLLMVRVIDNEVRLNRVVQVVIVGVTIVLLYGVLQRIFGENAVLVPGLTANATDAEVPDFLFFKYNVIDWHLRTLKLTSTYQNGNGLGINLLLLFPIAVTALRRWTLRIPLIGLGLFVLEECGSRSVWVGTLTLGLIATMFFVKRTIHKFFASLGLTLAVVVLLFYVPIMRTRTLNTGMQKQIEMGGRVDPAALLIRESLRDTNVVAFLVGPDARIMRSVQAQAGGAYEILLLALFQVSGVIGALLWVAPIGLSVWTMSKARSDPLVKAVFITLICYLIAALAEGAFWYPPTAFNLWMVVGIGWLRMEQNRKKVVGTQPQARREPARAPRELVHAEF
jgi:hypothetical protein